ncbi:MAG: hypothetical protein MK439_06715, partial [SAR324 cluster bacterium]|nr:hypothetical protein [SAR324 cluster bacterium]
MPAFDDLILTSCQNQSKKQLRSKNSSDNFSKILILSKLLNKNLELSSSLREAHFELKHLVS